MSGGEDDKSPPLLFSKVVDKYLMTALEKGLTEYQFWTMTLGEINRFLDSRKEVDRRKAIFDYKLADLIGYSCGRYQNSANKMPTIAEFYPYLFSLEEEEEHIQEQKDKLSIIRFKLFADSHNKTLNKEVKVANG